MIIPKAAVYNIRAITINCSTIILYIAIDEIPIVEIDDISDSEIEKENVKRFELLDNQLFRAKIFKTNIKIKNEYNKEILQDIIKNIN